MSSRNDRVENDRAEIYGRESRKKKKIGWREERHQESRRRDFNPRDVFEDDDRDSRDFD